LESLTSFSNAGGMQQQQQQQMGGQQRSANMNMGNMENKILSFNILNPKYPITVVSC